MLPVNIIEETKDHGKFGACRKFDIHTGHDFYTAPNEPAYCISSGTVIDVFQFTGEAVGTGWWNDTWAVVVNNRKHTFVYGEIFPSVSVGDIINVGDLVGTVIPVLKKDKGKNPPNMLHLEVWETGTFVRDTVWHYGSDKPFGLINPIESGYI